MPKESADLPVRTQSAVLIEERNVAAVPHPLEHYQIILAAEAADQIAHARERPPIIVLADLLDYFQLDCHDRSAQRSAAQPRAVCGASVAAAGWTAVYSTMEPFGASVGFPHSASNTWRIRFSTSVGSRPLACW